MNKNELKQRAIDFFELYPNKSKLWGTADGNFFLDKIPAQNHSRSAKIECFEFSRDENLETKEPVNTGELNAKVLELDPDTAEYNEMKGILKGLGVKLDSWKKPEVIAAFKVLKVELSKVSPAEDGVKSEDVENNLNQ